MLSIARCLLQLAAHSMLSKPAFYALANPTPFNCAVFPAAIVLNTMAYSLIPIPITIHHTVGHHPSSFRTSGGGIEFCGT